MRKFYSIFLTLIVTVLTVIIVNAQKPNPFNAKTANIKKIKTIFDFPAEGRNAKNGSGYSANVELLNPKPKKIALVSFYLYDPAMGKTSGGSYVGVATAKAWRTPDAVGQTHIDGIYEASIKAMKDAFAKYGMELLTPDEFIDTDDKAEFYYTFSQESAKREKTSRTFTKAAGSTFSSIAEASVTTLKVCPSGKGYRAFFVTNEQPNESFAANFTNQGIFGANRKMTSSLGYELAQGLGVDAVVVAFVVTRKLKMNKNDYAVNAISLYMFGPNPLAKDEEDKNRGQFYCGTRLFFSKPLIFHDKKSNKPQFSGFDNSFAALSEKLCNYVMNKKK